MNDRTENACRIFAGLIAGPGAVAYVRQGNAIQTPSGPVAGSLEVNFSLALDHTLQILGAMESRVTEDSRAKQRAELAKASPALSREQELKTQGPGHCQHGTPWDEACSACRTGYRGR